MSGMRDIKYYVGQPVKIFHADRTSAVDGTVTQVGRDLVHTVYGPFDTKASFRKTDQRHNSSQWAHLMHFRTLEQVEEEERYRKAVTDLERHGLIQQTGRSLPVETLEKIARILQELP